MQTKFNDTKFKKILEELGIKKGDHVLINSNILNILIKAKKNKESVDILKVLKKKITKTGAIIFPTYNWDFCKKKKFDLRTTKSSCGTLSNFALADKDFIRTKNPIYSFAIFGKHKKKIASINHNDCFSLNSPFGYLINNNGKNLFIDLDYKKSFTFVHVAEQAEKINYRYKKNFSGVFTDGRGKKKKIKVKMFVRKKFVKETLINKKLDKLLKEKNFLKEINVNNIKFSVLEIPSTFKILCESIKNKSGLVYYK